MLTTQCQGIITFDFSTPFLRSPTPRSKLKGTLVCIAGVDGFTVGDDDAFEGKVEQGAQRGQCPLPVPWRGPDPQLMLRTRCGERVREDDGAMVRQPQRRFIATASVVKGDEPSGKLAAGIDPLEFCHGDIVAEEQAWTESADMVAAREYINVTYMIRLEYNQPGRRIAVEPLPEFFSITGRSQRIEKQSLAT